MDKQLLKNLVNANVEREPKLDGTICPGEMVKVFVVRGDKDTCIIWNSSNNESFDKREICKEITNQILEDEYTSEGRISHDFNEIMFEIK